MKLMVLCSDKVDFIIYCIQLFSSRTKQFDILDLVLANSIRTFPIIVEIKITFKFLVTLVRHTISFRKY